MTGLPMTSKNFRDRSACKFNQNLSYMSPDRKVSMFGPATTKGTLGKQGQFMFPVDMSVSDEDIKEISELASNMGGGLVQEAPMEISLFKNSRSMDKR